MNSDDDDLTNFEAQGAAPLPVASDQGYVEHDGARIWYATYGSGSPVILLHGGLGHSGNWGYQVPTLVSSGHRAVLIDRRGHGRSTRDLRPFTYELMASDVLAVMDALHLENAAIVGWSDGACTALILARGTPARIAGIFFFACNMDPSGTKQFKPSPILDRCFARHSRDYAALSPTPDQFKASADAVGQMQQTEPNYSARDLADIHVPVAIVQSEHDEFIKPEHAEYLARNIPGAEMILLPGVSHFAPLQRPEQFNSVMHTSLVRSCLEGKWRSGASPFCLADSNPLFVEVFNRRLTRATRRRTEGARECMRWSGFQIKKIASGRKQNFRYEGNMGDCDAEHTRLNDHSRLTPPTRPALSNAYLANAGERQAR